MDNGEIDLWGTHIPVLAACVAKTTGPVLELGCGHYSTRLLHALCGAMGRQLLTVDVNLKWLARFADLRAPLHEIVHTDVISQFVGCRHFGRHPATGDLYEFPEGGRWSVVFEDSGIAQRRPDNLIALRGKADLFILNNTEPDPQGRGPTRPVYELHRLPDFRYRWDYKRYPVWTSVLSDSPIPDWLERLV